MRTGSWHGSCTRMNPDASTHEKFRTSRRPTRVLSDPRKRQMYDLGHDRARRDWRWRGRFRR